jgi:hypothetical protein
MNGNLNGRKANVKQGLFAKFEIMRKKSIIKKWLKGMNRFDRLDGYTAKQIDQLFDAFPKKVNRMHISRKLPLIDIL